MNTKIYKQVFALADKLMAAAESDDRKKFDGLYIELRQLCEQNDNTDKDHPVQWETLADFTEDLELAVTLYEKALNKAEAINAKDYRSSIGLTMATMKIELGNEAGAIADLEQAKISSNKIEDKELKAEIHNLLEKLKSA